MSTTTGTTFTSQPLTVGDIKKAVERIQALKGEHPKEWTLFSPDGRVWRTENVKDLALVVAGEMWDLNLGQRIDL